MANEIQIKFGPDLLADGMWINGSFYKRSLAPGTAQWSTDEHDEPSILLFVCPCGCGVVGALPVKQGFGGPVWKWDKDRDKPTLEPSIKQEAGCGWHGHLTKGVFKSV